MTTRYYNSDNQTEALDGVHFELETIPANIHALDGSQDFFTTVGWLDPDETYENGYTSSWDGTTIIRVGNADTPDSVKAGIIKEDIMGLLSPARTQIMLHDLAIAGAIATRAEWVAYITALMVIHEDTDANVVAAILPVAPS